MPEDVKKYKFGEQTYTVPVADVEKFMEQVPGAVELKAFSFGDSTYTVPVNELDQFMKQVPGAEEIDWSKKNEPSQKSTGGLTPGSLSRDPEVLEAAEAIEAGQPGKSPLLKRWSEKTPWMAAPINFIGNAIRGVPTHILDPLDGAEKIFYKGIGYAMQSTGNPMLMKKGAELVKEQDKKKTWWKAASDVTNEFAAENLPPEIGAPGSPYKKDAASALLGGLGSMVPMLMTLPITPNPSVAGIGMKLPINFATIQGTGEYGRTDDLFKAVEAGIHGAADAGAIMLMGYAGTKAGMAVTEALGKYVNGQAAGIGGSSAAAATMGLGGYSHSIASQLASGVKPEDLSHEQAMESAALFTAFGVPGIIQSATSAYGNAPKSALLEARKYDADVSKLREVAIKLEQEAFAETDPMIKAEKGLAAERLNQLASIKSMDKFVGENPDVAKEWLDKQDLPEKDRKAWEAKIEDAVAEAEYKQELEKTKDLATAGDKIAAEELGLTEKTPATKAMKNILKTGEEAFTRDITSGKDKIGEITIDETGDAWSVKWVEVDPGMTRKGVASETYRKLNAEAEAEGKVLRSDKAGKTNPRAASMWDKLVKTGDAVRLEDGSYVMKNKNTENYIKSQKDAIQERETEKVDVGKPPRDSGEMGEGGKGKEIQKEKVTYVTPETSEKYADMTVAKDGDYVFFHRSPEPLEVIDPSKSGTNKGAITTKAEAAAAETVGGISYYYTDSRGHEGGTGKNLHTVKVPKEKVYDADADPLGFGEKGKQQFKE